jgi:hypothetical protein
LLDPVWTVYPVTKPLPAMQSFPDVCHVRGFADVPAVGAKK